MTQPPQHFRIQGGSPEHLALMKALFPGAPVVIDEAESDERARRAWLAGYAAGKSKGVAKGFRRGLLTFFAHMIVWWALFELVRTMR